MVSLDDLDPILERSGLSYYLPSVTFGYIYYLNSHEEIYFYLMLATAFISTFMYVEEEIIESIEKDLKGEGPNDLPLEEIEDKKAVRDSYAHATPWLYFETIVLGLWVLSVMAVALLFVFHIDWGRDFWLSAFGFLNIVYVLGWLIDSIFRRKYKKHYYNKFVND